VRELVREMLQDLNYAVLEAADGPAGLTIVNSSAPIDLLITDVGLPGLNGRQLADAARQKRTDLKVLFMTGYAASAAGKDGFLSDGMSMITKPFQLQVMADRIQQIMACID
jgi:CheY-like chemotaxis protein